MSEIRCDIKEQGFTLVELLVVVVIVGILVAIAVPVYNSTVIHAKRLTVEANLKTIDSAINQFYTKNEVTVQLKNDLDGFLQEWPAGPDGVEYDISDGRAVISEKGDGDWFTAAEGDSLPITW
jgi:prepilin-type N-terminal cleavage/methylation domain-containing protein